MFRRSVCIVVLVSFFSLLITSCTNNEILSPAKSQKENVITTINVGMLHNDLVREFLDARKRIVIKDKEQLKDLFVETSKIVFNKHGYDFVPSRNMLDDFLKRCEQWKSSNVYDVFIPTKQSPNSVIDNMISSGVVPLADAQHLKDIFARAKRLNGAEHKIDPLQDSFLDNQQTVSNNVQLVDDVLVHSCSLWQDICGDEKISIDPEGQLLEEWWKTLLKWVGTGAADGLAALAAAYIFLGNIFAVAFLTAFASVVAYDAFDERGW